MATEPIIVTDTDDLRKVFAANITGFSAYQMLPDEADRLAGSLIEIMRANCPPPESPAEVAPMPEYVYLVSYQFNSNGRSGFGSSEIRSTGPLNSWAEVQKLRTAIAQPVGGRIQLVADGIVILNLILLSGPEA